ncbi:MAG: glycosylhydrolase-like jelly roll fold domain-containing protein, partial [Terriglobia bacterium]
SRIEGVHSSSRQSRRPKPELSPGFRWLQVAIPPLAGALVLPPMQSSWMAFIDGKPTGSEGRIPLPAGSRSVRLRVSSSEVLDHPWTFATQPAPLPLGSWNVPGLEHFSGQMTYEKQVDVPASLLAEQVMLDCGVVGVVAEAWINGNSLGSRAWAPFVFDAGKHLRAGQNHIRVRIANTEANARAVGTSRSILKEIDINGWHGPARLVPFVDREIECTAP